MARAPGRWVGRARAAGGMLSEGNAAAPVSGIRRELARAAAAHPMAALKACEGAVASLALASEERHPRESRHLDIFQMEIDGAACGSDREHTWEGPGTASDSCSEESNDVGAAAPSGDPSAARGDTGKHGPEALAVDSVRAGPVCRLFRNRSGHIPVSRPGAGAGGGFPAKPFGKLSKSLSGHQSRAGRLGDPDTSRAAPAVPGRQLMKQADLSLQGWAPKGGEPCLREAGRERRDKSAPVPIAPRFSRVTYCDDDGDNPFMPPHEYLVMKELSDDPDQAPFARPSPCPLKGLSSLRMRNMVLSQTGYFDGYTEMWQQPGKPSPAPTDHSLEAHFDFRF